MKPGKYRHFKGADYELIGVARHSETEEECIVYRQLYGDCKWWVRPLSMFNDLVTHEGKMVKRFKWISD